MIGYIIITFIIIAIFSFLQPRQPEKWFLGYLLCGFILILLAGFRKIGSDSDMYSYIDIFYRGSEKPIEPAIEIISFIIKSISNNFRVLFLIFAILGVSFKLIAIKQLSSLWFTSILIYVSYYFLYHEMTQIRAGIASGLLLLCIKPIYERDLKRFIIYVALAISFHISAVLIIPLWFLKTKNFNTFLYYVLIIVAYSFALVGINFSYLISFVPIESVQILFKGYIYSTQIGEHSEYLNIFSFMQLLRVSIGFFFIYNIDRISKYNAYTKLIVKIYIFSVISYVIFSDVPVFAVRISQFLGVTEIIAFPLLVYIFTKKSYRIALIFPFLIGVFMISMLLFYRKLFL